MGKISWFGRRLNATSVYAPFHVKRQPDNWVLAEISSHLESDPHFTGSPSTRADARINYFINYVQFEEVTTTSAAWFTHLDENNPRLTKLWWEVLDQVDFAIFQSDKYREQALAKIPTLKSWVVSPGVDLERFKPRKLRIGIVGRSYRDGRKGEDLVAEVISRFPEIDWAVTGSRWPVESKQIRPDDLATFYSNLDYLLIPSRVEGGPLPAIEALASGVPVISSDVGWMPELPHIEFQNGDIEDLSTRIQEVIEGQLSLRRAVENRSWENFTNNHVEIFGSIS